MNSFSWNFMFEYFFENLSRKIKFYQNLTRITGTLHEDRYNFLIMSCPILLIMNIISDKSFRKIRNTHFIFTKCFFENQAFEIMWKTCVEPGRTQMILRCMYIVWLIPKATNTLTDCVIQIAFPLQQWLHKYVSMLRYAYIACLVTRHDITPHNVPKGRHV